MSRNRIIYNVLALYASQVGPSGMQTADGTIKQLTRVQSFDEDFSRNLTDVNQFGNLAAIDRIEVEAPTVNGSLSYYVTDGSNENYLGLTVTPSGGTNNVSCISGILNKSTDEKNYYLLIADEGNDASSYNADNISPVGQSGVIALGNGFITSYSINAAVGEIPTATVDLEALNVRVYADADGTDDVPAVNPVNGLAITNAQFQLPVAQTNDNASQATALQPGDIDFTLDGIVGYDEANLKVQDFTLSFDLARTPLQKLGSKFAFSREIDFPVTATLEVNAEVGDLQDGSLASLLCDNTTYDFTITMKKPDCNGNGEPALRYIFKGAKLISQNFSSAIGDNATMSATYEVQLGSPQDNLKGIFISGSFPGSVVPESSSSSSSSEE
jgi:hypothetical protein